MMAEICPYLKDDYTCDFTREYTYDLPVFDLYCGCNSKCNYWDCPIYKRYA